MAGRRQAIIWTNAGIFVIEPTEKNFNGILIEIITFSFKNMHLKLSSVKWQPFFQGFNALVNITLRLLHQLDYGIRLHPRPTLRHWKQQTEIDIGNSTQGNVWRRRGRANTRKVRNQYQSWLFVRITG